MANRDFPRGLWPIGHLNGAPINTRPYQLTTGYIVRRGEVLKAVTGGTVEDSTAADGAIVIGVSADYVDDTDTTAADYGLKTVNVYDDPNIIFGVQAVTGTTPALIGIFAISDLGTCTSTTQLSNTELTYTGGNAQVMIIGKVPDVDNAWGEHADLMVIFNEHVYIAARNAVGTV